MACGRCMVVEGCVKLRAAALAVAAGKRGLEGASVHDDRLALRGSPDVNMNVVAAIRFVQVGLGEGWGVGGVVRFRGGGGD